MDTNKELKDTELLDIEKLHDNKFTIIDKKFVNLQQKVTVRCNKCGNCRNIKLSSLKYRGNCPTCSRNVLKNKVEQKIYDEYYLLCKEYCNKNDYTFVELFNERKDDEHRIWYLKFIPNRKDRLGEDYPMTTQTVLSIQNGHDPKYYTSDKLSKTTEEWVESVKKVHPEYDYSKVKYETCNKPVTIICKKHGEFNVLPKVFAKPDYCCGKCKNEKTKEKRKIEYFKRAREIHNNYYDYDESTYTSNHGKIRIICPEHGEFWATMKNHLNGSKCPKCSNKNKGQSKRLNKNEVLERFRKIHGNKYDYSKVEYEGYEKKICIICNEKDKYGFTHGEFWMTPHAHLDGQQCPYCSGHKGERDTEYFVKRAKVVHGNKYDYSNVKYVKNTENVCIICHEKDEFGNEHGEFWQTPKSHLKGFGCKKCSCNYLDKDLFIKRSNVVHGNKYDYSNMVYKTNHDKVCIICPEHGEFMMRPYIHLQGEGCPYCKESHLEREINQLLSENNIGYERQKYFDWLRNDKTNYKLPLDFYIPEKNIAIECQGEQHFIANFYKSKGIEYAEKHLEGVQYRDKRKKKLCKENGVKLIYYVNKRFEGYMKEDDIYFTNTDDLLNYLTN